MTIEWFGLPDELKRHSEQLDYRLKGMTNDQLRQTWMASTVPAVRDPSGSTSRRTMTSEKEQYVLDYPFPCQYDAEAKHWDFTGGEIGWDVVFERWKARGPMNERYVRVDPQEPRRHGSDDGGVGEVPAAPAGGARGPATGTARRWALRCLGPRRGPHRAWRRLSGAR